LGGWALQIGMPKYRSKKTEGKKWASSTCGWSIKGIEREKASMSYIGKDTEILWWEEHTPRRGVSTWEGMDHGGDSSNLCKVWRI